MLEHPMSAIVSMLRGINVGGHRIIKMDALRAVYESLGLRNPKTYVQSGNVVFDAKERNLPALARKIEAAIEAAYGFRPHVILRSASELRVAIAGNPFAERTDLHPSKLLVLFLAGELTAEARTNLAKIKTEPDELIAAAQEIYIYFPNGMGQSKLPTALIEKTVKVPATGRNWNTVNKLLEMAEALEVPLLKR
jgi:uncharacterized protein (DUF1697 family)